MGNRQCRIANRQAQHAAECQSEYVEPCPSTSNYSSLSCPPAYPSSSRTLNYSEIQDQNFKDQVDHLGVKGAPGLDAIIARFGRENVEINSKTNTITIKTTTEAVSNIRLGLSDKDPNTWYGNHFADMRIQKNAWSRDTGASGDGYSVKLDYEKDKYGRDTGYLKINIHISRDLHQARIDLGRESYLINPSNLNPTPPKQEPTPGNPPASVQPKVLVPDNSNNAAPIPSILTVPAEPRNSDAAIPAPQIKKQQITPTGSNSASPIIPPVRTQTVNPTVTAPVSPAPVNTTPVTPTVTTPLPPNTVQPQNVTPTTTPTINPAPLNTTPVTPTVTTPLPPNTVQPQNVAPTTTPTINPAPLNTTPVTPTVTTPLPPSTVQPQNVAPTATPTVNPTPVNTTPVTPTVTTPLPPSTVQPQNVAPTATPTVNPTPLNTTPVTPTVTAPLPPSTVQPQNVAPTATPTVNPTPLNTTPVTPTVTAPLPPSTVQPQNVAPTATPTVNPTTLNTTPVTPTVTTPLPPNTVQPQNVAPTATPTVNPTTLNTTPVTPTVTAPLPPNTVQPQNVAPTVTPNNNPAPVITRPVIPTDTTILTSSKVRPNPNEPVTVSPALQPVITQPLAPSNLTPNPATPAVEPKPVEPTTGPSSTNTIETKPIKINLNTPLTLNGEDLQIDQSVTSIIKMESAIRKIIGGEVFYDRNTRLAYSSTDFLNKSMEILEQNRGKGMSDSQNAQSVVDLISTTVSPRQQTFNPFEAFKRPELERNSSSENLNSPIDFTRVRTQRDLDMGSSPKDELKKLFEEYLKSLK